MKLLVISGGRHPYEESTPVLENILSASGHEVEVSWSTNALNKLSGSNNYDALIFNTLRTNDTALTVDEQTTIKEFIRNGKGFVCIHISGYIPDNWPEYPEITGGGWIPGSSFHPPYGQFTVNIEDTGHPCVANISDFSTSDELYMGIKYSADNHQFISAKYEGGTHQWGDKETYMPSGTFPLGWTRTYGEGKVLVTLLGHNGLSFETPEFQKIILNGIQWVGN